MRTVSTKLDNSLHSRFVEICNEDGKCQSEFLRNLIETVCEDCSEDGNRPTTPQDPETEHVTEPLEIKPISVGRIKSVSHDEGKTWIDIPELTNVTVSD